MRVVVLTIGLLLAFALGVASAQAQTNTNLTYNVTITKLDIFYKYMLVAIEIKRIQMDTIIEYAETRGIKTDNLVNYRNEFLLLKDELKNAVESKNVEELKNIIKKMEEVIIEFKNEAKTLLGNQTVEIKEKIKEALDKNKEYINSLIKEARELKRDRNIEIFDLALMKAENLIEKLKNKGFNLTDAEIKLNEIKEKREKFIEVMNATIDACIGYGIGKCTPKDVPEMKEYFKLLHTKRKRGN